MIHWPKKTIFPLIPIWLSWAISFHLVVQGLRAAFAAAVGRSRLSKELRLFVGSIDRWNESMAKTVDRK